MMMGKKISVVLTTYNGQKYLYEQMESLRKQTLKIDEVLILDDCSTDQTSELIRSYLAQHSLEGWKFIPNQTNQGWKKNFKRGFDLATGDYIFPCDQDDVWHPDKVQKMVQCMEERPNIELLAANYVTFFSEKDTGSGSKLYASRSKEMKSDGSVTFLGIDPKWPYINRPGCVFCFTKAFYLSIVDQWDTQYAHDAILWRFARMDHALAILNEPVIDFRRHGDNVTSKKNHSRQIKIKIFNDYIHFHEIALDRVKSDTDRKILKRGIRFLEKRRRFYETGDLRIWVEVAIRYRAYYNSMRGCLGDLYFVYQNRLHKRGWWE